MEDKDLKEFQNWIKQTQNEIGDWTAYLVFKAKKEGKTYQGAMQYLRKNRPAAPRSFNAKPTESFVGTLQSMFDEATIKVRDEALGQETREND